MAFGQRGRGGKFGKANNSGWEGISRKRGNIGLDANLDDLFPRNENDADSMDMYSADGGANQLDQKLEKVKERDRLDEQLGFYRYQEGPQKLGWLVNMHATSVFDAERNSVNAAVDYYFIEEDGNYFKCTLLYEPYFYLVCRPNTMDDVEEWVKGKFGSTIERTERIEKEDLKMANHLTGKKRQLLQLVFRNVQDLLTVRKSITPIVKRNEERKGVMDAYMDYDNDRADGNKGGITREPEDCIAGMREYDVPYYLRVAIDKEIRVGLWYDVSAVTGEIHITKRDDIVERAEPVVLAFDIETTKLPLKFPDAAFDMIMMISYMIDGQGYLITNREIVSEDIDDFEYTPKSEYPGPFTIFNEADEKSVIERFFDHVNEAKPTVLVTYNGDFFDWPFVHARAAHHGIDMYERIGWFKDENDEYKSYYCAHMDCLRWVKRDSYLPMGSQGLKAVTTAKLGYNPMEIDPEDMTRFAAERPQVLAQYSVSDAVATYYLYMKYVNPFIFSLCNIIPMNPDEVLRKGSGTLCETLLMVEAYRATVVMPNKHQDPLESTWNGHLIETETYVGGHVEALEAGVFRSDIPMHFSVIPEGPQTLINEVDRALKFSIEVEGKLSMDDIANYDEVRNAIVKKLEDLRDNPMRHETPLLYHLDVAAMYPNIILTNRLQPDSIVSEAICATCDFNLPGKQCDRRMPWLWRGEFFPPQRTEVNMIRAQLEAETFPPSRGSRNGNTRTFGDLRNEERAELLKKRVSQYSKKVYHRLRDTHVQEREAIICQRENPFYINTVRNFRDRRYVYKGLHKKEKKKLDEALAAGDQAKVGQCKKFIVVYDSLQLAHKCILNSFYGYVMRKQARWQSLEMAGVVCLTGSRIIQMARQRIEQLGRPLELDTDGIWCALPGTFPENFKFSLKKGGTFGISYPCTMLNHLVYDQFTNHQYQDLVNPETFEYKTHSENSIFFEVDGPYRAMILPSSREEDKLLKKRYAVFNEDGTLAELKGFEIKRRGELKLIKIFQSQIFEVFLKGSTLEECYREVASVANQWLDILFSRGVSLPDHEIFDLITENRNMSKTLEEYGGQKSTAICTARRLAEFLGDQMVKDKGLACKFIVSEKPHGVPVSERAVPVAIFSAEESVKAAFLRRWLKDNSLKDFDIRSILDWNYYLERFGGVIQKIITIPAAMQHVPNPVPRIKHPDWLLRRINNQSDKSRQHRITGMFKKVSRDDYLQESKNRMDAEAADAVDIEDALTPGSAHMSSGKKTKQGSCVVNSLARKRKRAASLTDNMSLDKVREAIQGLGPPPPIDEDYSAWLEYQKRKWPLQRQLRKLRSTSQYNEQDEYGDVDSNSKRSTVGRSSATGFTNLNSFFGQPQGGGGLGRKEWHLLQLAETSTPGELKAWVLKMGQLHSVRISVPRIFYISSSSANEKINSMPHFEDAKGIVLPRVAHQSVSQHLYRCVLPEDTYIENQQEWAAFFSHPGVIGVYETHISPLQRALIMLGSTVNIKPEARNIATKDLKSSITTFSKTAGGGSNDSVVPLETLERHVPQTQAQINVYQRTCRENLKYIYLYHATAKDGRQFFGLFLTPTSQAHVFIVDSHTRQLQIPNLEKLYSAKAREHKAQLDSQAESGNTTKEIFEYPSIMTFQANSYSTPKAAYRALNSALTKYSNERRGATMLVYHSPIQSHKMAANVRMLEEFPLAPMPSHVTDGSLAPLDWQRHAARRMMVHYLHISAWVQDRVELAQYSGIPMANLPSDLPIFLADIFFARRLVAAKHVLWWSPSARPDLGGREADESEVTSFELDAFLGDTGTTNTGLNAHSLAPGRVETNVPGSYNTVCVDLDVQGLAVGTVVQAPFINELEGSVGLAKFDAMATALDQHGFGNDGQKKTGKNGESGTEASSSSKTAEWTGIGSASKNPTTIVSIPFGDGSVPETVFQNLRGILRGWCVEVAESGNRYAAMMAEHFYRWLTHPASFLYDPSLVRLVRSLMSKVVMQMKAEVRNLGSKVVYCNNEKLIIATTMKNIPAAQAYVTYLVKALGEQPALEQVTLNPIHYWLRLLWMDTVNYGGIVVPATRSVTDSGGGENEEPRIEMSWSIKDFMPPVVHEHFDTIVAQFIYELFKHDQEISDPKRNNSALPAPNNSHGHNSSDDDEDSDGQNNENEVYTDISGKSKTNASREKSKLAKIRAANNAFYKRVISQRFTRILLDLVPKITETCSSSHRDDPNTKFPNLPGIISKHHTSNPSLEFVKAIVTVLNLEQDAEYHIRSLRRNLLSLLNVGEFSEMAKFKNPCQRLILPQVVCDYCNYCRDIDFCRDIDILTPQDPAAMGGDADAQEHDTGLNAGPATNGNSNSWACPGCSQAYNRSLIEERLVSILHKMILSYQVQDLKCTKCKMIKQDNLTPHCTQCSGKFTNMIPRSLVLQKLHILHSVAQYYGMYMLLDTVNWSLKLTKN
ncbi:DNA polymerase epsilon catalytic subunit [Mycoemilia scoparia]|uniref:DNA polymerase epsilon catalytic subunit n=1 Tax=Mycoemilia scoparia TaxID=417184 RepID=A0A9W8DWB2_9FUNG|nr:DNA polymerase epsilon catalytic subunit [Mycoemilia scoparia]